MGLSIDEVNAEHRTALAASLRKADDVTLRHFGGEVDRTTGSVDRLRGSSDQSRSVLANMAGNAAQDIGAIGRAAGTAGVAIGQLAEYATEGGISLGALAKIAGPMAILGLATAAVAGHLKNVAETKAFNKEHVEGFVEALEDGAVAAGELQDILAGDESAGIFIRWKGDTENVDRAVGKLFDTFSDFQKVVQGGQPAYDKWAATQLAAAEAAGANELELRALKEALDAAADGSLNANTRAGGAGRRLRGRHQDGDRSRVGDLRAGHRERGGRVPHPVLRRHTRRRQRVDGRLLEVDAGRGHRRRRSSTRCS